MLPSMYQSNAFLSKAANDSTKTAMQATKDADHGKGSHQDAAAAHNAAATANAAAGNGTQSQRHLAQAKVHLEKATPEHEAAKFAQTMTEHADLASKKADLAHASGEDPKHEDGTEDPRKVSELHQDAGLAHVKAMHANTIAGNPGMAKYHEGKAVEHTSKMEHAQAHESDSESGALTA
jgi:hypothetical protein